MYGGVSIAHVVVYILLLCSISLSLRGVCSELSVALKVRILGRSNPVLRVERLYAADGNGLLGFGTVLWRRGF